MNNEIKNFSKLIFLVNGIILVLASIVLLIIGNYSILLGYLIGSMFSYITYLMHVKSVNSYQDETSRPSVKAFGAALLRLVVSAIALAIGFFVDFINIFAILVGLLVIKVTILITSITLEIIKSKKEKKVTE